MAVTEDNSDMSSSAHEGLDDVTVIENQRNEEKMTELPDEIAEEVNAATVTYYIIEFQYSHMYHNYC